MGFFEENKYGDGPTWNSGYYEKGRNSRKAAKTRALARIEKAKNALSPEAAVARKTLSAVVKEHGPKKALDYAAEQIAFLTSENLRLRASGAA